jgi:hypothetical protein
MCCANGKWIKKPQLKGFLYWYTRFESSFPWCTWEELKAKFHKHFPIDKTKENLSKVAQCNIKGIKRG